MHEDLRWALDTLRTYRVALAIIASKDTEAALIAQDALRAGGREENEKHVAEAETR